MPAGGSPRSDACLARHQRLRFYFDSVLRWRGLREDRPDLTPVWHGTAPEAQILFYTYSRWKIWSEICRQIENGVLKNGKQEPTIFSDICTTSGHMGEALGGSPQSFKKHLSLSDIQNWSASEGKGSCLTGLRHEELQVSGRKQKCVWCLGSFSGWHWSDKENWHDDTQTGGLREAHGVLLKLKSDVNKSTVSH